MTFFGALVRTVVNTATLPVAVLRDVATFGGAFDNEGRPHTLDHLEKLKREAEEEAPDV